ncbi:hypothetical protein [Streptomyces sp. NPDC058572]|uniref:hypothetical protein n=1 Tax=Streptomyces sp. NPDC058572 TaxID=3346546 RepID=UPI0036603BAB
MSRIRESCFEVLKTQGSVPGITIEEAGRAMANFEVAPVATVPLDSEETTSEVNRLWMQHARSAGVFAADGSFLIATFETESRTTDWVRVRLGPRTDVSILTDDQKRIEFVARSISGHHICGVTAEEYDYWVVSLPVDQAAGDFTDRRSRPRWQRSL